MQEEHVNPGFLSKYCPIDNSMFKKPCSNIINGHTQETVKKNGAFQMQDSSCQGEFRNFQFNQSTIRAATPNFNNIIPTNKISDFDQKLWEEPIVNEAPATPKAFTGSFKGRTK